MGLFPWALLFLLYGNGHTKDQIPKTFQLAPHYSKQTWLASFGALHFQSSRSWKTVVEAELDLTCFGGQDFRREMRCRNYSKKREVFLGWYISVKRRKQTTTRKSHRRKGDMVRAISLWNSSLDLALTFNPAPSHRSICQSQITHERAKILSLYPVSPCSVITVLCSVFFNNSWLIFVSNSVLLCRFIRGNELKLLPDHCHPHAIHSTWLYFLNCCFGFQAISWDA